MKFTGRHMMVTGAASGLGEATGRELAARGAVPVLVDLGKITNAPDGTLVNSGVDITDEAEVASVFDAAGELRAVVHCAGIAGTTATENGFTFDPRTGRMADLGHIERIIRINLIGTLNVVRQAAKRMADNDPEDGERGVIVCTASIAAFDGHAGQSVYAASKAGVVGLTLPLARELAYLGIRVVTIAPGMFDTPILGALDDTFRHKAERQIPLRRMGRPAEFGRLACDVIGNPYVNAEVIRLDGGLRIS